MLYFLGLIFRLKFLKLHSTKWPCRVCRGLQGFDRVVDQQSESIIPTITSPGAQISGFQNWLCRLHSVFSVLELKTPIVILRKSQSPPPTHCLPFFSACIFNSSTIEDSASNEQWAWQDSSTTKTRKAVFSSKKAMTNGHYYCSILHYFTSFCSNWIARFSVLGKLLYFSW